MSPAVESPLSSNDIELAFAGEIEPVRVSFWYQVGLFFVAVVMVLLMGVYLGLLGWGGYLLYWHATVNLAWVTSRPSLFSILGYGVPLLLGGIFLLFLLKPFLARRPTEDYSITLDPDLEPTWFSFVGQICDSVGARRPSRVQLTCDVNASAGFQHGFWGMLRNQMVLTVGIPLVLGLNTRQLAGILAHEMGHFSQGAAMRLTFVVRNMNTWFIRIIFERDGWDEMLESFSEEGGFLASIVFWIARAMVWLSRKILWVLLFLGQSISSFMLRQMEFDADRYQTRLVGSDQFQDTMMEVNVLMMASQGAMHDLSSAWQDGRLTDDFAKLVIANVDQINEDGLNHIREEMMTGEASWWDSHPADAKRIEEAEASPTAGLFHLSVPSQRLFHQLTMRSEEASLSYYRVIVDETVDERNIETLEDTLARQRSYEESSLAFQRFFQTDSMAMRWLIPAEVDVDPPGSPEVWPTLIAQERDNIMEQAEKYRELYEEYEDAEQVLLRVHIFNSLEDAGYIVDPTALDLEGLDSRDVKVAEESASGAQFELTESLQDFAERTMLRLHLGLQLLHTPWGESEEGTPREERLEEIHKLLRTLRDIRDLHDLLRNIRFEMTGLQALFVQLEDSSEPPPPFFDRVNRGIRELQQTMTEAHDCLMDTPYPFPHANPDTTVATYIVPAIPIMGAIMVPEYVVLAEHFLDRLFSLYGRVMGRLVVVAEEMEAAVGLFPLPDPPPPEEDEDDDESFYDDEL